MRRQLLLGALVGFGLAALALTALGRREPPPPEKVRPQAQVERRPVVRPPPGFEAFLRDRFARERDAGR